MTDFQYLARGIALAGCGIGDDLVIVRTRIRRHLTPERIQILLAGKG